jgi:hypothetical protein
MIGQLAGIAFAQPWLLAGLAALPALWWLLRVTPPAPQRLYFPPLALLLRLGRREETPARTPWWLLLLRLTIAALLILGFARPVLNPEAAIAGDGPLLVVLDDGWPAAPGWPRRQDALQELLQRADREGREVILLRSAGGSDGPVLQRMAASEALAQSAAWRPRPWPADRAAALALLDREAPAPAAIVWLTDGISTSAADGLAAAALAERLERLAPARVMVDPPAERALLLRPPPADAPALEVAVERADTGGERRLRVLALADAGEVLGHVELTIPAGASVGSAVLQLQAEQRNRIDRLAIEDGRGAGAVALVDERWRRRVVGVVGGIDEAQAQPLLAEAYFIDRALRPFAELRGGAIPDLLRQPVSMIVLPDTLRVADGDRALLEQWIAAGGVLVRFAGPKLAQGRDDFVPVPLREGDRRLDGALSWSTPLKLAPFDPAGPFAGLAVPDDVTVARQVLARPGPELRTATLAALEDGTPLVTGTRRGDGWLVLIHTSANATWSNLAISGLFVDMLRRLVALAPGVPGALRGLVAPDRILDGEGTLGRAGAGAVVPVAVEELLQQGPGPGRPPGFWGPASAPDDPNAGRLALSPAAGVEALRPLDPAFAGLVVGGLERAREVDLMPWLLATALVLALADLVIGLVLRGLVGRPRRGAAAGSAVVVLLALATAPPLRAQDEAADPPASFDAKVMDAALLTRLAYVVTGDPRLDEESRAGLEGLGRILDERTAILTGEPAAVDLGADELSLYPILYWPIRAGQPALDETARARLSKYLHDGGMLVVDTGDGGVLLPGQDEGGPGAAAAAEVLAGLDLPPLVQVPPEHVLTRSFYLLQDFPGRWTGQPVWVDRVNPAVNDGVASIVIGGNDWAGAWAMDRYGSPLLPVVPGGESQREMAWRFGVNLVMYALSGNYKTDQVHVPALLERLGQ